MMNKMATSMQSIQSTQHSKQRAGNSGSNAEQAATMYKRVLIKLEAELGPNHPSVVTCRKNYETLLKRCNS
jgi:hypothetical protein